MTIYLLSKNLLLCFYGLFCDNDLLTVLYALNIIKCFWLTLPDSMYTALINHGAIKTVKCSNHFKDDWSKDGEAVHAVHSSAVITLHHKHASQKAPLTYVTISSFPPLSLPSIMHAYMFAIAMLIVCMLIVNRIW